MFYTASPDESEEPRIDTPDDRLYKPPEMPDILHNATKFMWVRVAHVMMDQIQRLPLRLACHHA